MRIALVLVLALLGAPGPASAQISIGITIGSYPEFVAVPGYPVYYAPRLDSNLFFYDGLYWVYAEDRWYTSSWYNGPWDEVAPEFVPLFVLRVPVRYYRQRPAYFGGWGPDAPPRWGEHWGRDWEQHHAGWDRWDHASAPAPAPLPTYQSRYSGSRYPDAGQQRTVRDSNYRYQPRDEVARQHYDRAPSPPSPAPRGASSERAPQAAPPADTRRSSAPPATRPEQRPAPAADTHRDRPDRGAAPPAAPAEPPAPKTPPAAEPQRRTGDGSRPSPPAGAAGEPRREARPPQAAPTNREAEPPRPREGADRPRPPPPEREQKKEPEREPKKEPDHDRDH